MITLISVILTVTALMLLVVMIKDGTQQRPDLLSMRNIFLLGLIVFQYTSGVVGLMMPDVTNPYAIPDRSTPGLIYTITLIAFTILLLYIYKSGFFVDKVVATTRARAVFVTWPKLLTLSVLCVVLGVVCRVGLAHIPYLGIFAMQFGASFFALSTGLAAWAWAPRIFNPIPAAIAITVTLVGISVLLSDSYGRRDVLGIGLAFGWGAYYSYWRYMPHRKLVTRFAIMSVLGILFLASYTSTRFNFGMDLASVGERVKALATADFKSGTADLFSGQNAATYSMYFIHTRPDVMEYDTGHSVKLFFTLPLPRSMFPNKPYGLSISSVKEINSKGKAKSWNIGPGLVGHIFNDNPFLALPIYALILALSLRFADQMLLRHAGNPFLVLPFGVALGQVLALPRGELGTFFGKTVIYTIGGWFAMMIVAQIHKLFSPESSMLVDDTVYNEDDYDTQGEDDHNQHCSEIYNGYEDYEEHDSYHEQY